MLHPVLSGGPRAPRLIQRAWPEVLGWPGAVLVVCLILGVVAGVNPAYALVAALALAFMAVVFANPTVGLVLFTFLSFLDQLKGSSSGTSVIKVVGLVLLAAWLAKALTQRSRPRTSFLEMNRALVVAGVALVAWSAISVAWATVTGDALTDTYRFLLNFLLIPIMVGTIQRRRHVQWFAATFLLGAVVSTIYGFLHPLSSTAYQAGQLVGTIGDANEQAAVLVGAIALAFGLVGTLRDRPGLRLLALAGMLISLAGAINTLSRSGLIALASMMIAGVIVGGRWRRWAALLLVFSAAGGIAYFAVLAPLSARNRVTSADTSGRSTIWKVGWRIVQAHPLLGAGSGNFQDVTIHYLHAPGTLTRADLIVVTPKVAHNIYLEMLADMGIPGLLAFLVLVGASVAAAWKAAKAFQRSGDQAMELMSRSAILAIVGFMTSDFFLSGQFSKQLWLAFGLGPTLLMLSRSTVRDPAVSPSIVASARSGRRLARAPA